MAKSKEKKEKTVIYLGDPMTWIIVITSIMLVGVLFWGGVLEYQASKKADSVPYEERYDFYEVVSVNTYVRNETNVFGGITDTDICYKFSYIDGNKVYHVDKFIHYEGGNQKVIIWDKDCYMVSRYEDKRYLQLTKETFNSLTGSSN